MLLPERKCGIFPPCFLSFWTVQWPNQQASRTCGSPLGEDGREDARNASICNDMIPPWPSQPWTREMRGYSGSTMTHYLQCPIPHRQRLRSFSISHLRFYIATCHTQRDLNMKANTATQLESFSRHPEMLQIWSWGPLCWVFTETFKSQHVQCHCQEGNGLVFKEKWRYPPTWNITNISSSWENTRNIKRCPLSDFNDILGSGIAHPSWLIPPSPFSASSPTPGSTTGPM